MPEGFVQVNVNLTEEDARMLDRMMVVEGIDNRSGYMRKLIRNEWGRRFCAPNPALSIDEAVKAASDEPR